MIIERLQIGAFRNISSARLEPEPGLNRLIGVNGAGKTSVLEAIHFLASGRSFRRGSTSSLRANGDGEAVLFARVGDGSGHTLGARLGAEGRELRLNGERASGFAAFAEVLKTIHYTPEGHRLASGGPRERRRFLDWGLFHVEPSYLELARRYHRALQQRNRWLKTGMPAPDPWGEQLASMGEEIQRRREAYAEGLEIRAQDVFTELGGFGELRMRLDKGWPEAATLAEALERDNRREPDTTRVGPHRGDLQLVLDGAPARERASRGQQKVIILALRLAQLVLAKEESGDVPVFLFDDVGSELDPERRRAGMDLLERYGRQVFVTSTEEALCPLPSPELPAATFRVHGGNIERSD
ncbi:DNA replication/repair protein RecF [Thiohalorhabdus sp. Cl-TMA]|uniref:DNA replication and repair protein RecF n=1 Tax=Thiohalorhabdus methylotrophus TaxID=3242694 RepID=A0ABV4TRL9_9GAMM